MAVYGEAHANRSSCNIIESADKVELRRSDVRVGLWSLLLANARNNRAREFDCEFGVRVSECSG